MLQKSVLWWSPTSFTVPLKYLEDGIDPWRLRFLCVCKTGFQQCRVGRDWWAFWTGAWANVDIYISSVVIYRVFTPAAVICSIFHWFSELVFSNRERRVVRLRTVSDADDATHPAQENWKLCREPLSSGVLVCGWCHIRLASHPNSGWVQSWLMEQGILLW